MRTDVRQASTHGSPSRIPGQPATLSGSIIGATSGLDNQGTLILVGSNAINGPLTTTGTSLIRVRGDGTYGTGQLTVTRTR